MNSSLSFRKESIQSSSNVSESLKQAQQAQGQRVGCEQRPYSITVIFTATQ